MQIEITIYNSKHFITTLKKLVFLEISTSCSSFLVDIGLKLFSEIEKSITTFCRFVMIKRSYKIAM
jgi:hypothetical protein